MKFQKVNNFTPPKTLRKLKHNAKIRIIDSPYDEIDEGDIARVSYIDGDRIYINGPTSDREFYFYQEEIEII